MNAIKPWHDCPPCAKCGEGLATPLVCSPDDRYGRDHGPDVLYCPACGATWQEMNPMAVARAWWAVGAYQASQVIDGEPTAHDPPWVRQRE